MKVLILTEPSIPNKYWEAALPLLRVKGIDAHFATVRRAAPLRAELEANGVPVMAFAAKSSVDYPMVTLNLARFVRKEAFDIVHASESIPAAISGISSFIARAPIRLFHRHHNSCAEGTKLFYNIANRTSDFMMTVSSSTKAFAHKVDGFDEDKIQVAYNGIEQLRKVESDEVRKLRNDLGISENARVISIVARLTSEKGHMTLFEAARIAADSLAEPLHIVVTGSGYYEAELRQAASQYSAFIVHFVGHREDIAPWYVLGDIVAVPSYSEPFGLVAAEAMSCKKPLIASGVDGLLEVVEDGVSGILVPPKNDKALADAILKVLKSSELANRLIENGQKRVREKFTTEKMVDGWINCYSNAVKEFRK